MITATVAITELKLYQALAEKTGEMLDIATMAKNQIENRTWSFPGTMIAVRSTPTSKLRVLIISGVNPATGITTQAIPTSTRSRMRTAGASRE